MAEPLHHRLADSLELLESVLIEGIYRAGSIPRRDFTRVLRAGYLTEITKGWYHVSSPTGQSGPTLWHGHYWPFLGQYLAHRYLDGYCLSAEQSLVCHAGLTSVPKQVVVITSGASNNLLELPHGHSILAYQERSGLVQMAESYQGLRVLPLSAGLAKAPEGFFRSHPLSAAALLSGLRDVSDVLRHLLDEGSTVYAGRLMGALRHVGSSTLADRIGRAMMDAGHLPLESNPFLRPIPSLVRQRPPSPYVARLQLMWADMREHVATAIPLPLSGIQPGALVQVRELAVLDAFHSLSIEGFRVDKALIERVRNQAPVSRLYAAGSSDSDAFAARGYHDAFQAVLQTLRRVQDGASAADSIREDHHDWFRAMHQAGVQAGIHDAKDLSGYRGHQVYIQDSSHVPLPPSAVVDAMDCLFDLLREESNPAVRGILGHFLFTFIHPYADGNGRMARFLMNVLFVSGGLPWTVIHVEDRPAYMASLETASTQGDIRPFTEFVASQMRKTGAG